MFDVLIIGGGMVGSCCAYECATHGLQTLLLEHQDLASGASGRGGGLLLKGATDAFAPQIVPHLLANQQLLENFLQSTGADVEYVRGGSLYIAFEDDWTFTQDQVRQMCSAGLAAELWNATQLRSALPKLTPKAVGGRFIESDAQLSPPQLTLAFAQAARQAGAELRTHLAVHGFVRNKHGQITGVQTQNEAISARYLILATNAYTGRLCPGLNQLSRQLAVKLCSPHPCPSHFILVAPQTMTCSIGVKPVLGRFCLEAVAGLKWKMRLAGERIQRRPHRRYKTGSKGLCSRYFQNGEGRLSSKGHGQERWGLRLTTNHSSDDCQDTRTS